MPVLHPRNLTAALRSWPARAPLGVWRVALLLTLVLFGLLLLDNRQYLFATRLYENADQAADSLLVREAKHHLLLHGHYSRWHFYHPGPALIDTLAAGEALFHDALHVVPTPYNGQLLALGLCLTLAFSLALAIFARQLGSSAGGGVFFLPLALLFALWHYGMVGAPMFLDAWPAYPPIAVFLCLLVAAAAVASGSGRELPVLAAAGGWLVHNNASFPLFVVPLSLLAYAGLLAACGRPAGAETLPGRLAAGWRAFPREHAVAAALLALFILPLVLDACHGRESNLAEILRFMRGPHEPGHGLGASLCYFLTFGGYDTFRAGHAALEYEGATGMSAYADVHWRAYALWEAAALATPLLFFAAIRNPRFNARTGEARAAGRFLGWFYAVFAVACGLTLLWGTQQVGPMVFYNAFFNYSLYYCLALGVAAAGAVALTAWTATPAARRLRPILATLLWLGVAGTAFSQAGRFRASAFGTPADAAMAATVQRAAGTLPAGAICFLDWDQWSEWIYAAAVALELERLGHTVRFNDNWAFMLGEQRTFQQEIIRPSVPLVHWMVALLSEDPARLSRWPLLAGCSLDMKGLPTLDPAGQRISFLPDGNYRQFALFGWSGAGSAWSWSDQYTGMLAFQPLPLPAGAAADVDLLISAWSARATPQRVAIEFNGDSLGTVPLPLYAPDLPPLQVRISEAQWQQAVAQGQARLQFHFLDAESPARLGLSTDYRLIGGGFRDLEFRVASEGATPLLKDGRYGDGWGGPVITFQLPGGSAGPDLLRVRGLAPADVGYRYPYPLICQFDNGRHDELIVKQAGAFDEVLTVPIPREARTLGVRLLAPQTFRPSQRDAHLADSRVLSVHLDSVECVSAANPLQVDCEAGWYGVETSGKISRRWTNGQCTLSVLVERAGTVVLETSTNSAKADNAIEVLVDGVLTTVTPCPQDRWEPVTWRLPMEMGLHQVLLRSRVPAVQAPRRPPVPGFSDAGSALVVGTVSRPDRASPARQCFTYGKKIAAAVRK